MSWSSEDYANARVFLDAQFKRVRLPEKAKALKGVANSELEDHVRYGFTPLWEKTIRIVNASKRLREQPAASVAGIVPGSGVIGKRREG